MAVAGAKPKLQLRDVTVCAVDSVYPRLAARALELCLDRCRFADAILFSDTSVAGSFRHVPIPRLTSLEAYSRFCLRDMPRLTETPYVLVVQWDGYVVDPGAWSNEFRECDYIGALIYPTDGAVLVGNGGFSLRSRKLLNALPTLPFLRGVNEDWAISRTFRPVLERDFGVRFATLPVGNRFSYEAKYPGHATLGFHGQPNFWRHESDDEILRIHASFPPNALISHNFLGLMLNCLRHDRVPLAEALYAIIRKDRSAESIKVAMARSIPAERLQPALDRLESTWR